MSFFRFLFFPISLVFSLVLRLRHFLFDKGILLSKKAVIPSVVIGNLSFGGTGKTPHIIELANALNTLNIAILSRGYKRKLKGIYEIDLHHSADEVGEEALLIKSKHTDIPVFVGNDRLKAIELIKQDYPLTQLVLLDDGFQHRALKPHLSIILEDSNKLVKDDFLFPLGRLRDIKSRYKSADFIIRTKSQKHNENLSLISSTIQYKPIYKLNLQKAKLIRWPNKMIALSAIADASLFHSYVKNYVNELTIIARRDHYYFKDKDIKQMVETGIKDIICTEKDAIKLLAFKADFETNNMNVWVLPIRVQIHNFEAIKSMIYQII